MKPLSMSTPLALYNLWHQGAKTLVSMGGVMFALLLVFMQLGFMGAVSYTATNTLHNLRFDMLLRASDYQHLYEPSSIDRRWLAEAANVAGVKSAAPLWITIHNWRTLPTAGVDRATFRPQYLPIAVMAFRPQDDLLALEDVSAAISQGGLGSPRDLLIDDSTHADYGPWRGSHFSEQDIGREVEIGGQGYRICGLFRLGTGLAANGAALMNEQGFARLSPFGTANTTSLGLIRLEEGADGELVTQRLRARFAASLSRLPEDWNGSAVEVVPRREALAREMERWLWQTPIGLIFQLGVLLALLVGAAIVYMVLSTDVANRLPEYATLLALGYSRRYLASIVMTQAAVLAAAGFLAAWGAAEVLYRVTSAVSNIPLIMTAERVLVVSWLGLAMCCISGLLALRKLWKAEPANLF
jgi:putative ABC transport system permease protein